MKSSYAFSSYSAGVIVLLALIVFFAGCTQQSTPGSAVTPTQTSNPASPTYLPSTVIESLPYGVTISVPKDWERQDVLTNGVRDYGKDTINIANFFSPNEVQGDSSSYNTLGIDVDQDIHGDFDTYFNQATIAVGKTYGTQMQAHSFTLKIGGYDSYELDFQTDDVKGTYIFTNAKGSIYIFAFKGPTKPLAVRALSSEITEVYKSIQLDPPPIVIAKQR
jgi:hypothetical protein